IRHLFCLQIARIEEPREKGERRSRTDDLLKRRSQTARTKSEQDYSVTKWSCRSVVVEFETPKALANPSPGFERSENPGDQIQIPNQPCKGSPVVEPLQGSMFICVRTQ